MHKQCPMVMTYDIKTLRKVLGKSQCFQMYPKHVYIILLALWITIIAVFWSKTSKSLFSFFIFCFEPYQV